MRRLISAFLAVLFSTAALAQVVPNTATGPIINFTNQATGTVFSATQFNQSAEALDCIINITQVTFLPAGLVGTLTVTIQGVDPVSGNPYTILASTAIGAIGTTVLHVGPTLTASANAIAQAFLPTYWNIKAAVATGPVSATVSCMSMI